MKRILEYIIGKEEVNLSIEKFLLSKSYTGNTITQLKKMYRSILLNNEWVYMNTKLSLNDKLVITILEEENSKNILPIKLNFNIIYEDEDILIINKPANMPIHPSLNNYNNSLANALAYYYKNKGEAFVFRCINRLDKDTTGLTIIAKNILSAGILYKDMSKRKIKRSYIAVTENSPYLKDEDTIDLPIARVNDSLITRKVDFINGERAVTHYKILEKTDDKAILELHLDTGRTHQIRVHMSFLGSPLIGDYLYNSKYSNSSDTRPLLHSYKLEFNHPINKNKLEFVATIPKDMKV